MLVAALAPCPRRGLSIFASLDLYTSLVQSLHTYSLKLNAPQVALNADIDIYALRGIKCPVDALDLSLMVPCMSTYGRRSGCRNWCRNNPRWRRERRRMG